MSRYSFVLFVGLAAGAALWSGCGGDGDPGAGDAGNTARGSADPSAGAGGGSADGAAGAAAGDQVAAMQAAAAALAKQPELEADRVQVQHVLISFTGAGTRARRTKAEAEKLAAEVFAKAKAGEDFKQLVLTYTDDSPPGIYGMVTKPQDVDQGAGWYLRAGMVPAFGNVGWRLQVGEVGIAAYDPQASKYGWHIIKRLQ